jgi:hypothetical protein
MPAPHCSDPKPKGRAISGPAFYKFGDAPKIVEPKAKTIKPSNNDVNFLTINKLTYYMVSQKIIRLT